MKRSAHVAAPLLASAALAILAGCRQQEMQRCVDENNKVVADNLCGKPQQGMRSDGHGGFIPFIIPYRYYYGGTGGFGLGSTVGGGAFNPTPGRSYATPSTRGGFGSTMSGGGEGAGE
ncbi:hypothetical protein [Granulicella arctica]|uniref:hypothetical protein n=1 Tax=Granulicella arctica TaxID=940613 RepID=UPI0021E0BC1B|nr:hypothetical protein [Granulicella arctica]